MSVYNQTKSYVLTASSSGIADLMSALYTHFNLGSGLWTIKSGTSSTVDGIIIEPVTPVAGYDMGISIRRNGTTDFSVGLDPLNTYSAAGSSGAGPTGASAEASAEIAQVITDVASAKIMICEYPDSIFIGFFNSGLIATVRSMHIGRCFDPLRESYREAPLLNNGLAVLVGKGTLASVSGGWFNGSTTSVVRNNGGWRKVYAVGYSFINSYSNPIPDSPNPNKMMIAAPIFGCYHDASTNYSIMLIARYFGYCGVTDTNRKVLQSDAEDEAWIYCMPSDGFYEITDTRFVFSWEKGVNAPA